MASELQAIVMAGGKGSRMMEVTAGRPKCLLPVGTQPMVWYPLQMLERAGFQDVILVVLESVRSDVQLALDRCGLKIRIDIVGIPAGEDWGTADTLRFLSERIKSDVLIISCDLVTDVRLHEVLDVFRKHQASIVALFFPAVPDPMLAAAAGPKTKHKPERDLVGLDPVTSRLVFLASASDFEETMTLSKGLLRKHQHVVMHSRLMDSHVYVLRRWVCQYLMHERSFSTLKGELLPYIVKKQLSKPLRPRDPDPNASIIGVDIKKDVLQFAAGDPLDDEIRRMSTFNDHHGDMRPTYHNDAIRCYAYVASPELLGVRANTLPTYCLLNKLITELWPLVTGGRELVAVSPSADMRSTQLDMDCVVGDNTLLSEKTSIRDCIIGANCIVEPKVRLASCILMGNVKVREGCVLTNCVLCDDVEIGSGSELKDCLVGNGHSVAPGGKHTNEVLTDMDGLMEI